MLKSLNPKSLKFVGAKGPHCGEPDIAPVPKMEDVEFTVPWYQMNEPWFPRPYGVSDQTKPGDKVEDHVGHTYTVKEVKTTLPTPYSSITYFCLQPDKMQVEVLLDPHGGIPFLKTDLHYQNEAGDVVQICLAAGKPRVAKVISAWCDPGTGEKRFVLRLYPPMLEQEIEAVKQPAVIQASKDGSHVMTEYVPPKLSVPDFGPFESSLKDYLVQKMVKQPEPTPLISPVEFARLCQECGAEGAYLGYGVFAVKASGKPFVNVTTVEVELWLKATQSEYDTVEKIVDMAKQGTLVSNSHAPAGYTHSKDNQLAELLADEEKMVAVLEGYKGSPILEAGVYMLPYMPLHMTDIPSPQGKKPLLKHAVKTKPNIQNIPSKLAAKLKAMQAEQAAQKVVNAVEAEAAHFTKAAMDAGEKVTF